MFALGGLAGGIGIAALSAHSLSAFQDDEYEEIRADRNYRYISPLLECEEVSNLSVTSMNGLRGELLEEIEDRKAAGDIEFAALYFKDLTENTWFGIDEKEKFSPASLLKVPVLMAFYKQAEQNPEILSEVLVAGKYDYQQVQNIPPQNPLEANKSYTVEQLVESMIVQSDNNAYLMLSEVIDEPTLVQVYKDIGINIQHISQENPHADFLTVREYASLFRVLYNATYLNEEYSEKALATLGRTTYKDGLVKYLSGVTVAHKFGERRSGDTDLMQLHDCGIVYFPEKPYLICIMTKGSDLEKQAETIASLSRTAFRKWRQMQ